MQLTKIIITREDINESFNSNRFRAPVILSKDIVTMYPCLDIDVIAQVDSFLGLLQD